MPLTPQTITRLFIAPSSGQSFIVFSGTANGQAGLVQPMMVLDSGGAVIAVASESSVQNLAALLSGINDTGQLVHAPISIYGGTGLALETGNLATLANKDFATNAVLQLLSATLSGLTTPTATQKISGQVTGNVTVVNSFALESSLQNLAALLSGINNTGQLVHSAISIYGGTGLAIESGNLATIAAKDFATQTTLAAIDSTLSLIKAKTDNIDVALSTRTKPADSQNIVGTVAVSNSFALESSLQNVAALLSGINNTGNLIHQSISIYSNTGLALETGNLATIAAKDFATQTTLNSLLTSVNLLAKATDIQPISGQVTGNVTITNPVTSIAVTNAFALETSIQSLLSLLSGMNNTGQVYGGYVGITGTVTTSAGATASIGVSTYLNTGLSALREIKATSGDLYDFYFANTNSSGVYAQIFNVPTGNITLGTTIPLRSFWIPPYGGLEGAYSTKVICVSGISIAITTDRQNAGLATSGTLTNIGYI